MEMTDKQKEALIERSEQIKHRIINEVEKLYASGGVGENMPLHHILGVAISNVSDDCQPLFPTAKEKKAMKNLKCF